MATAQDLINSASKLAGILGEGDTLEGGINSDALNRLNRMIQRWRNSGVDLGIDTLTASATVYVDLADEECIETNLALRLMARHRRPMDPVLVAAGDDMFTELQAKYCPVQEMDLDIAITKKTSYDINYE